MKKNLEKKKIKEDKIKEEQIKQEQEIKIYSKKNRRI